MDGNRRAYGLISALLALLLLCAIAFPLAKARASGAEITTPATSFEQQETALLNGMHLYFGNLHSHTGNSDGQGTPAEAFAWAKDTAKFDFYAVTDHSEYLDSTKWNDTGAQADRFNQDGRFVALRGFEYSHPYGGHVCVWNTSSYTNAILSPSISLFYAWLAQNNGIAQFNHPGREPGIFNKLAYDKSVAGNMSAIEVGNKGDSINGNAYYPYYPQALDKGWRVGPSSNQDNHTLNANSHRTVLASPELTRAGLLESLNQRRFYSTDDPNIKVLFKCGGNWMGSTAQLDPGNTAFSVLVSDDEPIAKLELIGGAGQVVQEKDFDVNQASEQVTWNPTIDLQSPGYYFLKITERDIHDDEGAGTSGTQMAVTAPIWADLKIHEPGQLPSGNWYKGDLHSHSTYSDGDCDVATVVSIAEGKGLDFFALTDHNTNAAWYDPGYSSNKMTLLNGIEWTTSNGHANILSNKPFDISSIIPTWQDPGDAKTAIDLVHSLAGEGQKILFSINHPYAPTCAWKYGFEDSKKADCMEVWNSGYVWPNLNFLSVAQTLDQYYGQRKRISMSGGSDSHIHKADWSDPANAVQTLYHDIGMPTTWVYASSNSAYDILDGIQKGHVFISHNSDGPQLQLFADSDYRDGGAAIYGIMMGDAIPRGAFGKEVRFRAVVKDAKMTDILAGPSLLVVIKNGKPLTSTVGMSADYTFDFNDTPKEGDYYRVELRQLELNDTTLGDLTQLGWVVALTNPIYAWQDPSGTPPAPALRFQTADRGEQRVQGLNVPAHTRSTFKVNDLLGAGHENSLKLDATQPVVAERPMYFNYLGTGNHNWNGGHCVVGVPALSKEYFFAEGSTRRDPVSSFEEWLTLQNTNDSPITIAAVYQLGTGQGGPIEKKYVVPAHERTTVFVPDQVGSGKDVSVRLSSPSTFLAERPIYFSYGASGAAWQGGHCVSGATRPAGDWLLAEGCTYPGFQEYLCLQNPGDQDTTVEITYTIPRRIAFLLPGM